MTETILVVEDDLMIQDPLKLQLERAGFKVLQAFDGNEAVALARQQGPDLVLLDVMLPGMDGWTVCRALREQSTVPILMLTARDQEMDRVYGLENGADDYIVKPFSFHELLARVRANLRRVTLDGARPAAAPEDAMRIGAIHIDLRRHLVSRNDTVVALSHREFELLRVLAAAHGAVLERDTLLNSVWGPDWIGDPRTVDVHIRWLREKLEEAPGEPRLILTVRGVGYRMVTADEIDALPWWRTLQSRMVAVQTVVLVLALAVLNLGMDTVMRRHIQDESLAQTENICHMVSLALQAPMQAHDHAGAEETLQQYDLPFMSLRLVDPSGRVVAATNAEHPALLHGYARPPFARPGPPDEPPPDLGHPGPPPPHPGEPEFPPPPPPAFQLEQAPEVQAALHGAPFASRLDGPWSYGAVPIVSRGSILGALQLARHSREHMFPPHMMLHSMLSYTLFALAVALLTGFLLSRRIVHPLRELEAAAGAVAAGDLERMVPLHGDDELTSLARAFNRMTSEIRGLLERQQFFIANASHELRTPLTNIKLRAEALLDDKGHDAALAERYLTEIDRESERLGRLASRLLDVTRTQREILTVAEPVDVTSHLRSAADSMQLAAERARVKLEISLEQPLPPLAVEPHDVEDAVINLLDNAIKYTPAGGSVKLSAETSADHLSIRVADTGRGIAQDDLPYVFDWFFRSDRARTRMLSEAGTGTGLGLSIVRLLTERNGGAVRVESVAGEGSCFTLEFKTPRA